ncbi:MAG: hypothetical protein GY754_10005 [bacterium]|nr:hypothetical protein [bacterium]
MAKRLLQEYFLFLQILSYWPFVFTVMLPMRFFDSIFGTTIFKRLVNSMKYIANA